MAVFSNRLAKIPENVAISCHELALAQNWPRYHAGCIHTWYLFKSHFKLLWGRNYCGHVTIEKIGTQTVCYSKVTYLGIELRFKSKPVWKWIHFISIDMYTEDQPQILIKALNLGTVMCSFVELWLILFPENRVANTLPLITLKMNRIVLRFANSVFWALEKQ